MNAPGAQDPTGHQHVPSPDERRRPTVWQWLGYCYGVGLPWELSTWVLHDTTGRTWVLRHLFRAVVQMLPFVVAAVLFLPLPLGMRITAVSAGAVMGLIFVVAYIVEATEHRLEKAGYAPGVGERARQERAAAAHAATTARLRQKAAQRARRRAGNDAGDEAGTEAGTDT